MSYCCEVVWSSSSYFRTCLLAVIHFLHHCEHQRNKPTTIHDEITLQYIKVSKSLMYIAPTTTAMLVFLILGKG